MNIWNCFAEDSVDDVHHYERWEYEDGRVQYVCIHCGHVAEPK